MKSPNARKGSQIGKIKSISINSFNNYKTDVTK